MNTTVSSNRETIPLIIGHRGAMGHAPENTLASFRKAHELGATWVEFDVKLTADHEVIVLHDDTLDRTSNGSGCVSDITLAGIRGLDAGAWFSDEFAGEPVPSFTEAIRLLCDLSLGANVEIKPVEGLEGETAEAVCRVIAGCWLHDKPLPLISSFKDECLAVVRDRLPGCDRSLLVLEVPDDWEGRVRALGCNALHVWHEPLTQDQVTAITGAGYPVRCYTVNEAADAQRLLDWGVESIITNYPDRMAGLRHAG